jgi:hypothetical protein
MGLQTLAAISRSPLASPELSTLSSLPLAKAVTMLDKLWSTLVSYHPLLSHSSLPLAKAVTTHSYPPFEQLCF